MVKEEEDNSGTGYEDGQYAFILYNQVVLTHKTATKLLIFVFSFDSNKLNDSIVRVSLETSRVFLMTS